MIQTQFLNYLLSTKDSSLLLVNNIDKEFFSDYPEEYEFITEHLNNYGNIPDITTFASRFPDFDFISVTEPPNYLIDRLYEDRNARKLSSLFNKIRQQYNDGDIDLAMNTYLSSTDDIAKAKHIESVDLLKDHSRYDDFIDRADDWKKFFVKTGFPELDEIIGGWDRQEELATIVARSNQGKSWILLKCACAAAEQGLRVGIYSGEMSARKVGYRVDTLLGHISNTALVKGDISIQNEYKQYLDKLSDSLSGVMKVLTPNMIGGPAGVTALRAFIEKDKLDILFVDQHSLLEDDRKAKNPVEKASNISKDLKNLQVLKQIPIISVSQQNRASTENGVGLEHVAQSDRIAQDSTIVLFFEQKDGIITMHLIKSRDSANMKDLSYAVDLNRGIFTYIPMSEDGDEVSADKVQDLIDEYEVDGEDVF